MRKIIIISLIFLSLLLASPMFVYWWGLSNVPIDPIPSNTLLTDDQKKIIWVKEFGEGEPRVEAVTPYGYIKYFYCGPIHDPRSSECHSQYPGLRLASFAVRMQLSEQLRGKGNTVWQFSWMAYSIWTTQNWTIEQILATYHDASNFK